MFLYSPIFFELFNFLINIKNILIHYLQYKAISPSGNCNMSVFRLLFPFVFFQKVILDIFITYYLLDLCKNLMMRFFVVSRLENDFTWAKALSRYSCNKEKRIKQAPDTVCCPMKLSTNKWLDYIIWKLLLITLFSWIRKWEKILLS